LNPLIKWKNLVENPNVLIRRDVTSFSDLYEEIEKRIDFLRNFSEKRKKSEEELARITQTINNIKSKATSRKSKKNEQIMKDLSSLMLRQKKILEGQKKAITEYKLYAKDTAKQIYSVIGLVYSMNLSILTLLHRERVDADKLIEKVKAIKGLPGPHKEYAIKLLNHIKIETRRVAKKMYDIYQYQERSVYNPVEALNEISLMTTRVKCKRIRHLSVEIDTYENYIQEQLNNLRIGNLQILIQNYWIPQLKDIEAMAENHVSILSRRAHKLIYNILKSEELKKKYKNTLRKIVSQSSYLLNSIQIEEYQASPNIIQFKKTEERKEIKKAA
jgi:cell division septum initiation protein DivIVA